MNKIEQLIDTLVIKFKKPLTDKEYADKVLDNKTEKEAITMSSSPAVPDTGHITNVNNNVDVIDIARVVKAFKITPENLQATRVSYLKELESLSTRIVDLKDSIQTLDEIANKMRSKVIMP